MQLEEVPVELKVEGMTCANCAASITKYLEGLGLNDVYVNFATKEVRFNGDQATLALSRIKDGINKLGYFVVDPEVEYNPWWSLKRKLFFSAIFTLPLLLQHFFHMLGFSFVPGLDNPWIQLIICTPVFVLGFLHYGRSAWKSIRGGIPNMDVLIFIGSTAAFIYSLIGTWIGKHLIERISETLFRVVFRLLVTVMALRMLYVAIVGAAGA